MQNAIECFSRLILPDMWYGFLDFVFNEIALVSTVFRLTFEFHLTRKCF